MELNEIQNQFKRETLILLPEYELMTKTELANGYCDAEEQGNEKLRSAYWAALMLRYWYRIYEWINNSKSLKLPPEEFITWLNDAMYDAFYYRSWRYEYKAVVKHGKFIEWKLDENGEKIPNDFYWQRDPNAPDKSINYFCAAKRGKMYQHYNKKIRRGNVTAISLDSQIDEKGDGIYNSISDCIVDIDDGLGIYGLVKYFIDRNKLVEALIIDGIAKQNTFKDVKEKKTGYIYNSLTNKDDEFQYTSIREEFNIKMLAQHLHKVNQEFLDNYFTKEYNLTLKDFTKDLKKIRKMNNTELYEVIRQTLDTIKEDKDLLNAII